MNPTYDNEAPARPPSKPGASNQGGYSEPCPHASSISPTALNNNPQHYGPIVEAIRILARRGRQLREAEEAAAVARGNAERQTSDPSDHITPTASIRDTHLRQNEMDVSYV